MLIFTTLFLVYTSKFYKRTKEGNREYEEWMAFKRYILKKDNTIHEFSDKILSRYATYASAMKLDREFRVILKRKYKEDESLVEDNMLLQAINMGIIQELSKTITSGIRMSEVFNILFTKNHGNQTLRRQVNNDKVILITQMK
jgi:hypothetical protein